MHRLLQILTALGILALGTSLAGSAFAAPSASIEQVRNGQATSPTTPVPSWGTGNAGASNSHYLESHSTSYRSVMAELPTNGTVIELVIAYDVKRSGSYALDYLTHYQRLLPHVLFGHSQPEVFDPLNGISGVSPVVTTAPIPLPTRNLMVDPDGSDPEPAALQPSTSMAALSASERVMTLFGGTLIDVTYVTEADVSLPVKSSETRVRVRFTANSPTAVLAWGGHIGCRWDWGFNSDGTPRSAGGISGSSYHMRLVGWNLDNLGSQDRSMSTDAVYPVPRCIIANLGPFCAGTTNTHTAPAGMESYAWSLADNTSGAVIVGSTTGTSVTVQTASAGSYRLVVTTGASGFTRECDATVTVNAPPTADAGADLIVCSTAPQVQLAGAVSGGTGTWTGGTGTFVPGRSAMNATYTPSAAEITAGVVTLTLTSSTSGGPCTSVSDQVRITIQRATTANAGLDQIVCATNPLVNLAGVVGGAATGGTWSGGEGAFNPSASALNATYTPSAAEIAAGGVTLTLTTDDPVGPCVAAGDQMRITINPAATVNAGLDQAVCATAPQVQLAGVVGGGAASGTWSGGAGSFSPNASAPNAVYTPNAAEIAAGGVTLTLTTNDPAGPCGAGADQMRITINPAATVNAGLDATVCSSLPQVQLAGVVGGGAASGTWGGGEGTFNPSASTLNANYTPSAAEIAAGGLTLTLTTDDPAGPCGAGADQMRITINPAATVNAGLDAIVCSSLPQVQLAGVVGGGATSGTWSGGTGSFSPNASALNALYTPSAAEIAAGGVTLTLTTNDPAGLCVATSDQVHVNINPAATVNAGLDATVCSSLPQVQLAGVVGGSATSGTWSGGSGSFSPNASTLNAIYTPSAAEIAAGGVTLTLTTNDPAGLCVATSDQMHITINPAATVNAGLDATVCSSLPQVQLAGVVGGGATSGTWSGGTGSFSPHASALNALYTPSAAEIAAGGVTLTLTTNDPAGLCVATSDQVHINISPAATVNAGLDATVCSSLPQVQLAGVVGGGATSGTWSGGTGSFSPHASAPNAVYTPSAAEIAAGGVTLTLTTNDPAGPCGAAADQMRITINPAATVSAGPDLRSCASVAQVQLAGVVGGGATSGTWSGGSGSFSPNASALNATYTPSAAEIAAGGVTLTFTTSDPAGPCGPVSDQVRITIDPVTVVSAGPDATVCSSLPQVQLTGSVSGTVTTGAWTGGTGTFNPGRSSLAATYTPSAAEIAAGSVTLTLTSTASSGPCPPASDAMAITINLAPMVNAGADPIVCSASPLVQLMGVLGNGATSALWSGGSGTFTPNAATLNATYMPSAAEIAARTVTLTLTTNDPVGPCPPASDQVRITIDAPTVTVPSRSVCSGITPASLCATPGNGVAPYTYLWSNGATTQCISVADTGTYTVTLTDSRGCQATGTGGFGWRECVGMIAHTSTTCGSFMDGTADDLVSEDIHYIVRDNIITSISPGVMFYFTKVIAPSPNFTVDVVQTKDNPVFPFIPVQQGQVSRFDAQCSSMAGGVETSPGQSTVNVQGARTGEVLIVSVKYSLKDLIGTYMPDTTGCHYDFITKINGVEVDRDPEGITIGNPTPPPPAPGTPPVNDPAGDVVIVTPPWRGDRVFGAGEEVASEDDHLALYRPSPNPFNAGMRMAYAVGGTGERVRIGVFDLAGRRVHMLVDGFEPAGRHAVAWDGRDEQGARVAQGVYFVHTQVGAEARRVRVMFVR